MADPHMSTTSLSTATQTPSGTHRNDGQQLEPSAKPSVPYIDLLLLGHTGIGKSTTGDKLLAADPYNTNYIGRQQALEGEEVVKEASEKRQFSCDDITLWKLSSDGDYKKAKERIKRIVFQRSIEGENIYDLDREHVELMTNDCELLANETSRIRVLDVPGFFGSYMIAVAQAAAQIGLSPLQQGARNIQQAHLGVMRQIFRIQAEKGLIFRRILYFLPLRGPLSRADAILQSELLVMKHFFGRAIFECMVMVATVPSSISKKHVFDSGDFAITKRTVNRALELTFNPQVGSDSAVVPKLPDPPIIYVSLEETGMDIYNKLISVDVELKEGLQLKLDEYVCYCCPLKVGYYMKEKVVCIMDDSGRQKRMAYDESKCHPMMIKKHNTITRIFMDLSRYVRNLEKSDDVVCANCGKPPGIAGCKRIGTFYEFKDKQVQVDHETELGSILVESDYTITESQPRGLAPYNNTMNFEHQSIVESNLSKVAHHKKLHLSEVEEKIHVSFLKREKLRCGYDGLHYKAHDISIIIPEGSIALDHEELHIEVGITMNGPFNFPRSLRLISPIIWFHLKEDKELLKVPLQVTVPHILNGLTDEKARDYHVCFCHSDHFSDHSGQLFCEFQPLISNYDSSMTCSFSDSYATVKMSKFCTLCVTATDNPKLQSDIGYRLTTIVSTSQLRHEAYFCLSYDLGACLQAIEEQFPENSYTVIDSKQLSFIGFLKFIAEDNHDCIIHMKPQIAEIRATDVDIMAKEFSEVKSTQGTNTYMYFKMTVNLNDNVHQVRVQIKVKDSNNDERLCTNLSFPLRDAEEEKHITAVQKAMEDKGILDHTIVHGVFVGLARSGKDSLMKRLLGKKLSSKSPSTGVAENTVQVNVMKKSTTIATNVEESCWTEMDYDDEAIKLMSISTHSSLKQLRESPMYQEGILVEALVTMPVHNEDEVAGNASAANPTGSISASTMGPAMADHQEQASPLSSEIICPPVMPDVSVPNPLDILKGAMQSKGLEALKLHFQKTWSLYLTNTGGQMEFQEVLPLLVSGPSVFLFTFRLDRDLSECYSIEYELTTGGKSYPYTATSTTIEGILHTLASVSAMGTFVYQGLQKREAPLRPKVFFIGTHKDKLNPNLAASRIASIDRQLQEIITSTTHFKDLVEFASPSQLIFTVNNFSESESDFQGIRSAVERVVMRGDFQMTSPAHWLIFSLALRKLEHPVVSYDHCYKIAQQCGIESQKELDEALYFIHSKMGLIRYFPYEELKDIVIIDPQFLFDKVTELIVDTFTFEKVGKSEMDEFKHKGIFSIAEFEQKTQSEIYSLQFGKLLVHLRIAAPFEMNKKKKLFLPCVLAHATKSIENVLPSTSVPALLIVFECGYCPKGVPGALIKYLMTNEMESSSHWILLTDKISKDQISFRVGAYDIVVIKILPTHFELNCIPDPLFKDQRVDNPVENTCSEVLKALNTGIPQILKDLNYLIGKSQHLLTFQCKASRCKDNSHPAQLILDSSGCSGSLMCQKTKQCFKLPTNSYYWGYGENPCQESHLHASSRSEYQTQRAAEQQKHATQISITEQEHSLQAEHAAQASSEIHTQLTEQSQNLVISSQQPTIQDCSKNQQTSQLNVKQHYSILHKQLIKYSNKWTEIASHLGFRPSEIENIQAKPLLLTDAPASWFRTMLEQWLQWAPGDGRESNGFATLEDLKEALSQAGLGVAAHDLHT